MGKCRVIYDIEDDGTKYTLEEKAKSWEEAQKIRKELIDSPNCYNIQIIDMDFE